MSYGSKSTDVKVAKKAGKTKLTSGKKKTGDKRPSSGGVMGKAIGLAADMGIISVKS